MHYNRHKRTGDPNKRRKAANGDLIDYFTNVLMKYEGDECTSWPFQKICNGRAGMSIDGKTVLVSRVVCAEVNGAPPSLKHEAAHNCGHSWCVTKKHFRWATHKENDDDKVIHGTRRRGSSIGNSKLNESQVRFIRSSPLSARQISEMIGISRDYIYQIRSYATWKHVQP